MQTRSACGNVLQRRNGALLADPARLNASLAKKAGTLSFPSQSAAASLQLLCPWREPWLIISTRKDLTRCLEKAKLLKQRQRMWSLNGILSSPECGKQAVRAATRLPGSRLCGGA